MARPLQHRLHPPTNHVGTPIVQSRHPATLAEFYLAPVTSHVEQLVVRDQNPEASGHWATDLMLQFIVEILLFIAFLASAVLFGLWVTLAAAIGLVPLMAVASNFVGVWSSQQK